MHKVKAAAQTRAITGILAILSLAAGLFAATPVGAAPCACKEKGVLKSCVSDQAACDQLCGKSGVCFCESDPQCPPQGESAPSMQGDKPVGVPLPLGNVSLSGAIGRSIRVILGLTGTMALAMFVYAGFVYMTAAGNSEKIEKSRRMIVWSVLGVAAVFVAYSAVNFIIERLTK